MNLRKTLDLSSGPVTGKLLKFVYPILITNLLQYCYNAADKAVVGHFSGSDALAAVGASTPINTLIVSLFVGLAVGTNIICSNLRGAKKEADLERFMHTAIPVAFAVGLFVCLLGQMASAPMLRMLSTPEDIMDKSVLYMQIHFFGIPFSLVYNFCSGILRAHGDTQRPMRIMTISGIVNVALNLFFVIVFGMDVDGVALATAISQAVSAGCALYFLFKPDGDYGMQMKKLRIYWADCSQIIKVGVPCGINSMVFGFSNVILQSTVNTFGSVVLAGNTAASSTNALVYQILVAFYSACISFSGQCYGAKKYKRIDRVMRCSFALCLSVMAVIETFITLFPALVMGMFNPDPEVIRAGLPRLLIGGWGQLVYAVSEIILGCLRGMKRSTIPTIMNILCICGFRILWVWLIYPMMTPGMASLFWCYPISYAISSLALGSYYIYCRRKLNRLGDEVPDIVTA